MLSVCRTQASAALSSCEAKLFAANGLMVVAMYGYRLSKFLSQDDVEGNSEMVQQRLFTDSSSALALPARWDRKTRTCPHQTILPARFAES